jgi:branched-chain amino acid transport system ATP-binding protein
LLRALSGFTTEERGYIKSGSVMFQGKEVVRASAFRHSKLGIALIPEREKVFADLTVYENLLVSRRKGDSGGIERALEPFPALHSKMTRRASLLSGGERQMLALARALILEPKVLLIDETTLGLAPRTAGEVMAILRELVRGADRAIVLVEQNVKLALSYSDRYLIINRGEVVSSGDSADGALESHETLLGYGG